MTTLTAIALASRWRAPDIWQLGRAETRRLLVHPAYLLAVAPAIIAALAGASSAGTMHASPWLVAYTSTGLVLVMFYPLMTLVAAYRVTANTYRRSVRGPFEATPMSDRRRTTATMIALARGPLLVGVLGTVVLQAMAPHVPPGRLTADQSTRPIHALGLLDHVQIPLLVLGGGLLGIALARWAPLPGMPILAPLVLWFAIGLFIVAGPTPSGAAPTRAWLAPWVSWITRDGGTPTTPPVAQNLWHIGYLLGLSLLAGAAALLRTPSGRVGVLAASAGLAAATAVAGILQIR